MNEKDDVDELYADLVWLLDALEKDKDVTAGPEVVRAAMKYIEKRMERAHGEPKRDAFSHGCFDCENDLHICADCCAPLKHGQTACGKPLIITNVPLERVVENDEPKEVFPTLLEHDVPVSQLLTGDSVFSESAGTWHDVRVDGQALFLKRGESWVPMSHLPRDTKFRTRRGASGRAAGALFDAFGGEVIRDAPR